MGAYKCKNPDRRLPRPDESGLAMTLPFLRIAHETAMLRNACSRRDVARYVPHCAHRRFVPTPFIQILLPDNVGLAMTLTFFVVAMLCRFSRSSGGVDGLRMRPTRDVGYSPIRIALSRNDNYTPLRCLHPDVFCRDGWENQRVVCGKDLSVTS